MGICLIKVAIIGAGIGGLCCGIRLAHAGYDVSIYEKEASPGGVAKQCNEGRTGIQFDSFATIGIHPEQYGQVFHDVGLDPQRYFKYNFETFFGEPLSNYVDFINSLAQKYDIANRTLLTKPLYRAKQVLTPKVLNATLTLNPIPTAQHIINKYITSKKLTDFLLFQTFYMGLDPQKISNVYASIPAVTQTEGLIYVMGGMGSYISGLVKAFPI